MRGQTTVYCIGVMQVMLYTFFVKLPILYINESTGEKQSWEIFGNEIYEIYKEKRYHITLLEVITTPKNVLHQNFTQNFSRKKMS